MSYFSNESLRKLIAAGGIGLAIFFQGCSGPAVQAPPPAQSQSVADQLPHSLDEAVNSPMRTPGNSDRDRFRHPVETLTFFGIEPNMTVVEVLPSGGWYGEILAPYLAEKGHYISAANTAAGGEGAANNQKFANWLSQHPLVAAKATTVEFAAPTKVEVAPPGSVDAIVTFRNFHNWMRNHAQEAALNGFFRALKPGGILGIVEHRADQHKKQDPVAKSGYVRQDYIIKLAKKAGFKLVAKSEINANPKDTKDYKEGVWTLPPTFRLGQVDHDKYAAIGESDRMTLKFIKPTK